MKFTDGLVGVGRDGERVRRRSVHFSDRLANEIGWPFHHATALPSLTLSGKLDKPALHFRTVMLQPTQELHRRLVRVLTNRMNFVAGFKVGYVVS
jgi:hypothetical protein